MREELDPILLTPEERRRRIAAILATGLLRLHARSALPPGPAVDDPSPPQILSESRPNSLELSPKTRLSVHAG